MGLTDHRPENLLMGIEGQSMPPTVGGITLPDVLEEEVIEWVGL